jgi:hypothetical protein
MDVYSRDSDTIPTVISTGAHLVWIPCLLHGPEELESLLVEVLHVPPYLHKLCHNVMLVENTI